MKSIRYEFDRLIEVFRGVHSEREEAADELVPDGETGVVLKSELAGVRT